MSYLPPSIGPAGLSIPSYNDILGFLVTAYQSIYGPSVYLGNDSSDFQMLSVYALAASDAEQAIQLDYNNRAPTTAIGAALDSIVALNGLTRKAATNSTCSVTLSGTAGAAVNNGVIANAATGDLWNLPTAVVISGTGTVTVTAIAQQTGTINALAGQLMTIVTPTAGWISVTNSGAAVLGQPVETDAQLRVRQAISTELPSITILAGTVAAIAATPGVTRYNVLENNTNATDSFGNPPHSVTAVVEGGDSTAIATAIYNNRGIGPLTNGTTMVPITDPNSGITLNISFDRPTYVPIFVTLNVHLGPGGSSATTAAMVTAIVNYLNSLQIGEVVTYGTLVAAAMSVNVNLSAPVAWVRTLFFGTTASPTTITDVVLLFNQVSQGAVANVVVNPV